MKTQIMALTVAIVVIAGIVGYIVTQPTVAPSKPAQIPTSTPTPTSTSSPTAIKLKVAVVMPGPITDASWNMLAYQSLERIKNEMNIEYAYSESIWSLPDAGRVAKEYANSGYDLIYLHGGQYPGTALEVAKAVPNTTFATVGEILPENLPKNLAAISYLFHEPFYLMGYVAAKMTKTNKIGVIGGLKMPTHNEGVNAFKLAIEKTNPSATVTVSFIGVFNDPVLAKEAALAQIGTGVDVILFLQNEGAKGIYEAIKDKKVYTYGYYYDQNTFAPTQVLTSTVLDLDTIFKTMIIKARSGTLGKSLTYVTVGTGTFKLAPFYGLVPKDVEAEFERLKTDIIAGKLVVPRNPVV